MAFTMNLAYNFYFHDERQKLQARLFEITGQRPTYTQISKLVGASWRKIKPNVKARYEALAMKDRQRYALDFIQAKQREEHGNTEEIVENVLTSASAVNNDCDISGTTHPIMKCGNAVASAPPGINPCSMSYQVMLRQSLNENTMCKSYFLNTSNPQMLSQMALLSEMMIDYVKKVAPERLGATHATPKESSVHGSSLPRTNRDTANPHVATTAPLELSCMNGPTNSWNTGSYGSF